MIFLWTLRKIGLILHMETLRIRRVDKEWEGILQCQWRCFSVKGMFLIPAGKSRRQITVAHELTPESLMVTTNYFGISSFNFRIFYIRIIWRKTSPPISDGHVAVKAKFTQSDLSPDKEELLFFLDRGSIATSWRPTGPSAGASLAH